MDRACPNCNGNVSICRVCKGVGDMSCSSCKNTGKVKRHVGFKRSCFPCFGSNYYVESSCWICSGFGRIPCNACTGGVTRCDVCYMR